MPCFAQEALTVKGGLSIGTAELPGRNRDQTAARGGDVRGAGAQTPGLAPARSADVQLTSDTLTKAFPYHRRV